MNDLILKAKHTWKDGNPEQALRLLDVFSLKEDTDAHFLKGEIHYSRQEWGLALNCFRKVLHLDPSQIAAQTYVELILNILGFFHTDQFNP
jgi:hypothetical protein